MRESIRNVCGVLATHFFSGITEQIACGETAPQGKLGSLISSRLIQKAAAEGDHEALRRHLAHYWTGCEGDSFYSNFDDRFEKWFLGGHYPVFAELTRLVSENPGKYSRVVEVGCGDGRVLHHLSEQLDGIEEFVGIDINEGIIGRNRDFYDSDKLKFVAGDATEWIGREAGEGTILATYGGVMEYFLENELADLYETLKEKAPVAVVMVEPLYDDFDLEREEASRSSGGEHSFSHNYPLLLRRAGFEIAYEEEPEMEFRWLTLMAEG